MNKIGELMRSARFHQDPFLAAFGIQIDNKLAKLEGRVLPAPRIEFASKQGPHGKVSPFIDVNRLRFPLFLFQTSLVMPKDGVWRCENERFYTGGSANGIGVISFLGGSKDRMAEYALL